MLLFRSLPIQEPLTVFVQFDAQSYDLALVSLERLHVLTVEYLLGCSFLAAVISQFQLNDVDVA